MGRPREFDNDDVLTALQDVFWEHGYEGAYALASRQTFISQHGDTVWDIPFVIFSQSLEVKRTLIPEGRI